MRLIVTSTARKPKVVTYGEGEVARCRSLIRR